MIVDDIFEIDIILRLCKAESEDGFSDDFFGMSLKPNRKKSDFHAIFKEILKIKPEKAGFWNDFCKNSETQAEKSRILKSGFPALKPEKAGMKIAKDKPEKAKPEKDKPEKAGKRQARF